VSTRIHYTKPSITEREVELATDAARNGWGERCYDYIVRFEQAFADHLGVKHAIATSSCTGALHMGMAALGIGPGDEVIMGDINWIASAAPVTYLGAKPILVDVLRDTWCLDPEQVEASITPRTKAILAVHLYGNLCELGQLLEIGKRHGIPVIEDSAEAIGSVFEGARAGSIGAFGTFSFHGTKTLTTGEGGMWVTNDSELFERVRTLSNHGRRAGEDRQFWPNEVGFKYKMSNVSAAIGCGQMERIEELIARKRAIFAYYRSGLAGLPLRINPPDSPGRVHGYWMPTFVVDEGVPFDRSLLLARFKECNIDGRVFFWPLSETGHFESRHVTPVSKSLSIRGVNLPSYHDLTEEEMDRVVSIVRDDLQKPG
jgi:perosamine synthetase